MTSNSIVNVTMAYSAIRASTCLCSSSSTTTKPTIFNNLSSSSSTTSLSLIPNIARLQLRLGPFSPWSGLKHLGVPVSWRSLKLEKKQCKDRVAYASLFGVGAPEALVIGVVALLVFGPKGLAEVARSLGKTLRAFQPTIRELQEVSREFKSTLEKEIGLDEISSSTPPVDDNTNSPSLKSIFSNQMAADPNGSSTQNNAYTSEEYLKVTEEQLKAASAQQQGQTVPQSDSQLEAETNSEESISSAGSANTTGENLEARDQQPIAASSQEQGQEQKSSPAATIKETAS